MVLDGRLPAHAAAAVAFIPGASTTANSGRLDDGTGRDDGRQTVRQGGGEDMVRARLRLRSGGCGRRRRGRRSWRIGIGIGRDLLRVLLATAATSSRPSFHHDATDVYVMALLLIEGEPKR